jgi:hypothetical protein
LEQYAELKDDSKRIIDIKKMFEVKIDNVKRNVISRQEEYREKLKNAMISKVIAQLESKYNERLVKMDIDTKTYIKQSKARIEDFMKKKYEEFKDYSANKEQTTLNLSKLAKETNTIWDRKIKTISSQMNIKLDVLEKKIETMDIDNDPQFDKLVYDYNSRFEKKLEKYEQDIKEIRLKLDKKVTESDIGFHLNGINLIAFNINRQA